MSLFWRFRYNLNNIISIIPDPFYTFSAFYTPYHAEAPKGGRTLTSHFPNTFPDVDEKKGAAHTFCLQLTTFEPPFSPLETADLCYRTRQKGLRGRKEGYKPQNRGHSHTENGDKRAVRNCKNYYSDCQSASTTSKKYRARYQNSLICYHLTSAGLLRAG